MSNGESERVADVSGSHGEFVAMLGPREACETAQGPLPRPRGSRWRVTDEQPAGEGLEA